MRPSIVTRLLRDKEGLAGDLVDPKLRSLHGGIIQQMAINSRRPMPSDHDIDLLRGKWLRSLNVAEDYAVASRIHPLLLHATEDLPDDYVAEHHHLHAEHGFLWLEEPLQDEVLGSGVRVLTWHAGSGYSERGGGVVAGLEVNVWQQARWVDGPNALIPSGADFLPWGMASAGWQGIVDDPPDRNLSIAIRYVIAFQTFARMQLPAMSEWPVPKSQRQPMHRLGLDPAKKITVIDLRQRQHTPSVGDGERVVNVRHVVRGHWHAYWVGSSHPLHSKTTDEQERVHIYVHPFMRGPEDGPLAMTQRVHIARR
jgi:hypothetical protein